MTCSKMEFTFITNSPHGDGNFCSISRRDLTVPLSSPIPLTEIPSRLSAQHLFEGDTARAMMDALKAIAQSETQSLDSAALSQVVRKLLLSIHIVQVRNSESEIIDLLSAMNRLDRQLLATLIHKDCPLLAGHGWVRNIFAVVKTVRRVEGQRSELLDEILAVDWGTLKIRSVILEVRGG